MLEGFYKLTTADYLYAALTAFVATQLILYFLRFIEISKINAREGVSYRESDRMMVIKKCIDMFPVETIYFRGKVFTKGMKVRIITLQKRIIEGELIGKNDMDILCIVAGQHIIAHEIEKIEDMTEMPKVLTKNNA
ncbi:MAG TPA: hypothetical protein DIC60_09880 [Lachnospiraceae bacterium]|jgi:hypothetical protein|nr:hypothetical protein [Lachnospiraceae bacterium]